MKTFISVIDGISEWSGKSVAFLVVIMTVLIVMEIIMRYGFNSPTIWSSELVTYLAGIVYLWGGACALSRGIHVRVDLIYGRFSQRTQAIMDLASFPLLFITFAVVTVAGVEWSITALVFHQTSGSQWAPPIWPMRMIIPVAAFLLLIQGIANCIRCLQIVRGKKG
jgi:TRAP-type mannitol/chloroaromatic compound transport system permease small subunit